MIFDSEKKDREGYTKFSEGSQEDRTFYYYSYAKFEVTAAYTNIMVL